MKIIDVHRFNRKFQMLNEWSNFKHKIANIVSKIIKKLAIKIKDDYDFLSGNTDLITISNFVKYHIKKKENFNLNFIIEDISSKDIIFNFSIRKSDLSKMNGNLILNGYNGFSVLNVYFPLIENEKELDIYLKNNFLSDLKKNINHELTHYFDKKIIYGEKDYLKGHESKSVLDYFLYMTQKIEMRAIIQELVSFIHSKNKNTIRKRENKSSLLKLICDRFRSSFEVINKKSFLEKCFISCFVSYIFNEKKLKERYWNFLIFEKDISVYILKENDINEIRDALISLNDFIFEYRKNILNDDIFKNNDDDILLFLESKFFNTLEINIEDFSKKELFSKFADFYFKNFPQY